jgi:hypothetical protein
MTPEQKQKVLD